MLQSSRKWQFDQVSPVLQRHLRPHERLPLQLLGLTNRGVPRTSNGLIMLRRQSADSELTLADLLTPHNCTVFAKPKITIRKGRLILNFGRLFGSSYDFRSQFHSCCSLWSHLPCRTRCQWSPSSSPLMLLPTYALALLS